MVNSVLFVLYSDYTHEEFAEVIPLGLFAGAPSAVDGDFRFRTRAENRSILREDAGHVHCVSGGDQVSGHKSCGQA